MLLTNADSVVGTTVAHLQIQGRQKWPRPSYLFSKLYPFCTVFKKPIDSSDASAVLRGLQSLSTCLPGQMLREPCAGQ